MTDREILDKYIDLEDSCLTKQEKQKLRDIIYDCIQFEGRNRYMSKHQGGNRCHGQ